jgi:hypothetical protein
VKAILRERLSNTYKQKGAKRIKWDLDKLKEPNDLKQYQNTLEELLRINSDQHTEEDDNADIEVEKEWDKIKQSIILAASQTIGEKKIGSKAEWLDTECMDVLKRKNEARITMLQHGTRSNYEIYNDYQKKANKICWKKKREMMKRQIGTIEELNSINENRKFYRSVLQITHGYQPKLNACKDKQGKMITNKEGLLIDGQSILRNY